MKIKYHFSKKYLEDPLLKKVFSNKNNMLQSIRRSMETLPNINVRNKNLSIDKRLNNPKYQAVI